MAIQYPSDYVGVDGKVYPTVGEAFRHSGLNLPQLKLKEIRQEKLSYNSDGSITKFTFLKHITRTDYKVTFSIANGWCNITLKTPDYRPVNLTALIIPLMPYNEIRIIKAYEGFQPNEPGIAFKLEPMYASMEGGEFNALIYTYEVAV